MYLHVDIIIGTALTCTGSSCWCDMYMYPIHTVLGPSLDQQVAVKSKMAELQLNCRLLVSQVSNMKNATSITSPDAGVNSPSPPSFSYFPFPSHVFSLLVTLSLSLSLSLPPFLLSFIVLCGICITLNTQSLSEMATMISKTCDSFLKTLSECMLLSTTSMGGMSKVPQTPVDQSRCVYHGACSCMNVLSF